MPFAIPDRRMSLYKGGQTFDPHSFTPNSLSPVTPEQIEAIRRKAESALTELIGIINHTPHLAAEIQPLIQSPQILAEFEQLTADKPDVAEQLLRLSLAMTVNYHTVVETGKQLGRAAGEPPPQIHGDGCSHDSESRAT